MQNVKLPVEYKKCTGCEACVNICDFKAIEMSSEDVEGFRYPVVNQNCIDCGKCRNICPQNNPIKSCAEKAAYAAFSAREEIRNQSSSGGLFYELAEWMIDCEKGGVCGAAYDKDLYVNHELVWDKKDLHNLMVSKYMQSNMSDIYIKIARELKNGSKILFCGTPCQVHALKMFLNLLRIEGDIITIDLLCHSIPSPKAAHKCMETVENEYGKKLKYVTYKNKTYGWHSPAIKYIFEDDTSVLIRDKNKDFFVRAYLVDHLIIRRSCFECKYKTADRVSDITIGDFWGIKDTEMDDNKGTSAVMIHTRKGRELFQKLIDNGKIKYKDCDPNEIILGNPIAFGKTFFFDEKRRAYFWKLLDEEGIATAVTMAEKWNSDIERW